MAGRNTQFLLTERNIRDVLGVSRACRVTEYTLPITVLRLPYVNDHRATSKKGRVKVELGGKALNVESAARQVFESLGYEVVPGDDVHLASMVLAGKFMSKQDSQVFRNWAHQYGYQDRQLDELLTEADELLQRFLSGEKDILSSLLDTLKQRWNIYYDPVEGKKRDLRVLCECFRNNQELADAWIRWYASLPYAPGGAPDLFLRKKQDSSCMWVEVKSLGDNLQRAQWEWIEGFQTYVGGEVRVLRIVPTKRHAANR